MHTCRMISTLNCAVISCTKCSPAGIDVLLPAYLENEKKPQEVLSLTVEPLMEEK